jgi:site-specific recombinase XerD
MFTTMYGWGLRRREAARLEVHDWRRQARLAEFGDFAGLAVRWGKSLPGQPPRRRMVISVWPWAVATVRYYVERIRPLFYRDGPDDGVMFPTERGGEISVRSVNDHFAHWRVLTGLPDYLCPHCLRHTYVTRLIEAGYDASFVTVLLSHWGRVHDVQHEPEVGGDLCGDGGYLPPSITQFPRRPDAGAEGVDARLVA